MPEKIMMNNSKLKKVDSSTASNLDNSEEISLIEENSEYEIGNGSFSNICQIFIKWGCSNSQKLS